MSSFILGLDVGTTSVKAVLLAADSRTVAASHALPTTADIIDDSGIEVSFPRELLNFSLKLCEVNTAVCLSACV